MSVFAKVEGDSGFLSMVEKDGGWYRVANRIAASAAKVTSMIMHSWEKLFLEQKPRGGYQ